VYITSFEPFDAFLSYRCRDRVGGVDRNIGVAIGDVPVQERVMEQPQ
jgi:hypothetical protein